MIKKFKLFESNINKQQEFNNACEYNNIDKVKLLLSDTSVEPSVEPTFDNNRAFYLACENDNIKIVKLLLDDGRIDPTFDNNAVLYTSLYNNRIEILKLLLDDGRIDTRNNIDAAYKSINKHAIEFIIEHKYIKLLSILYKNPRTNNLLDNVDINILRSFGIIITPSYNKRKINRGIDDI